MTKEEFINKAIAKHGNKYDYSKVPDSVKYVDKIDIICPTHGVFTKSVGKHLSGQGCQECSGRKHHTTESFIKKIKEVPSNEKYDLSKVVFVNYDTKVTLICPEHGDFDILPGHLLNGEGCPKCRYIKSADSKRRSISEVIAEARKVHGDKYDYSLITNYKNDRIKYDIICPTHGVFSQAMNNHIQGKQGCPICGRLIVDNSKKIPFSEFVKQANEVHKNKYSYYEDDYEGASKIIKINCPKHGDFYQNASNHIHLGHGCPRCANVLSKGEDELYEYIKSFDPEAKQRVRNILSHGYELDIYSPKINTAFEFDGLYWHNEDNKEKDYHLNKTLECNSKGIRLFHIFEDEWNDKKDIVKSMLCNLFKENKNKIYARKCIVKEVNNSEAKNFLDKSHIQGKCQSKVKLGLYYNDELVSLMTFGKCRHFLGDNSCEWELLRFCNKLNTNIIGGASKLFKHFISNYNPQSIVSYADRRWSTGNIYDVLGFTKYNESKPNYYYIVNNKRVYRFNLRKSVLVKKYGCDENISEREFCYKIGFRRIYDCGCLCYKWVKNVNN